MRRTHAFAKDVGVLTVPGGTGQCRVKQTRSHESRRVAQCATYPCNTRTFGAEEAESDMIL